LIGIKIDQCVKNQKDNPAHFFLANITPTL
jgi:hypothetical protein